MTSCKKVVDPGADSTVISAPLFKKIKTNHHGSTPLNINTTTVKQKNQGNVYSLTIPWKEGDINIYGYRINSLAAEVKNPREWPQYRLY